jgi:hypothetical protein
MLPEIVQDLWVINLQVIVNIANSFVFGAHALRATKIWEYISQSLDSSNSHIGQLTCNMVGNLASFHQSAAFPFPNVGVCASETFPSCGIFAASLPTA